MATGDTELEALYVRIYAKYDDYFHANDKLEAQTQRAIGTLRGLETHVGLATRAVEGLGVAISSVAQALPALESAAGAVSVQKLATAFQSLQANQIATSMTDLSKSLQGLASVSLTDLAPKLRELSDAIVKGGFTRKAITPSVRGIVDISNALGQLQADVIPSSLVEVSKAVSTTLTTIGAGIGTSGLGLGRTAAANTNLENLVKTLSGVDTALISSIGTALKDSLAGIGEGLTKSKINSAAAKGTVAFLADLGPKLAPLSLLNLSGIKGFRTDLQAVLGDPGDSNSLAKMLSGAKLTNVAPMANIDALDKLTTALGRLGRLNVIKGAGNLDDMFNSIGRFSGKAARLSGGLPALDGLVKWMQDLSGLFDDRKFRPRIEKANTLIGNMALVLNNISAVKINLPDLQGLNLWLKDLITIDPKTVTAMSRIGRGVTALSAGLTTLNNANLTAALKTGQAITVWANSWANINPVAIKNMAVLGQFMGRVNKVTPPPNVPTIGGAGPSGGGSVGLGLGGIRSFSGGLTDMFRSANQANQSLNTLRLTMAGFAGLGVAMFAKFDDALTRTLAHMRDWSQEFRMMLEESIINLAASSTTGANDLAKGLDTLTSSGMNAAMALQALQIAETFSVASGMKMTDATEKLVNLQRTLAMSSSNVAEHFANMNRLSDLFVGIAPMVGSTTSQLVDAFGNRFVAAMQNHNMKLEEAIALMGVYSIRGIKGSDASDRAQRALHTLGVRSVENITFWRQLGLNVWDTGGKMKSLADVAEMLEERFGTMGAMQRYASQSLMGLEQRSLGAILPLVGMSKVLRDLEVETGKVGGISEQTARMMRESFLGQLKILWNTVSNIAREIGKVLAPAIMLLGDAIRSFSGWLMSLNPAMRQLVIIAGVALLVIPPLTFWLVKLTATMATAFVIGPVLAFTGALLKLGGTVIGLVGLPIKVFTYISTALTAAVTMSFAGLIPLLINLVSWFFIITTSIALIVTLAGVAATLFRMWVGAVGEVLAHMRANAGAFFDRVNTRIEATGDALVGMWDRTKVAAIRYFDDVSGSIEKVAGFFWHFRDNVAAVWEWLVINWRTVTKDIAEAFFVIVRNISHNWQLVWPAIRDTASIAFNTLFGTLKDVALTSFMVVRELWSAMLADMGVAFEGFGKKLLDNLGTIMGVAVVGIGNAMAMLASAVFKTMMEGKGSAEISKWKAVEEKANLETERLKIRSGVITFGGPDAEARKRRRLGEISLEQGALNLAIARLDREINAPRKAIENLFSFAGPEGSQSRLTSAMTTGIPAMFEGMSNRMAERMTGAGENIANLWRDGLADPNTYKGLLEGFKAITDSIPFLNLALPADWATQAAAMIRNFKPFVEQGDMGAALAGKQGPGFHFKQISEARFMTGGPVAQTLDYQQLIVLQMIQKDTAKIAGAAGLIPEPLRGPGREPIAVMGD